MSHTHPSTPTAQPVYPQVYKPISPEALQELREAWQESRQRKNPLGQHFSRYVAALKRCKGEAGINAVAHNVFVDYLDANYPDWRGEVAPRVICQGVA